MGVGYWKQSMARDEELEIERFEEELLEKELEEFYEEFDLGQELNNVMANY